MTSSQFCFLIVCTFSLTLSYLPPCALPTQACRGRALQLIRDLPVEFHCDKRSYSCRRDGEKAALAVAIALLGVSKMKRLHFEARPLVKTPKHLTQSCSAFSRLLLPLPLFCRLSSSRLLCSVCGKHRTLPLSRTVSAGAKWLTSHLNMLSPVS